MKLFIFEPYEWAYCGGALAIIAESYEKAVEMVIEQDKINAAEYAEHNEWQRGDTSVEVFIDRFRTYRTHYFGKDTVAFDATKNDWDQWLLTNSFEVNSEEKPRVVLDNWNNA